MQEYYTNWLNKGIERLSKFFRKNLDEDQKTEYLFLLERYITKMDLFNKAIETIIENNKYFPTVREIKNTYTEIYDAEFRKGGFQHKRLTDCLLCGGYGLVTIEKKDNDYALACKCAAGASHKIQRHSYQELKYQSDIKLTEKENKIYLKLIAGKNIKPELKKIGACPWDK